MSRFAIREKKHLFLRTHIFQKQFRIHCKRQVNKLKNPEFSEHYDWPPAKSASCITCISFMFFPAWSKGHIRTDIHEKPRSQAKKERIFFKLCRFYLQNSIPVYCTLALFLLPRSNFLLPCVNFSEIWQDNFFPCKTDQFRYTQGCTGLK